MNVKPVLGDWEIPRIEAISTLEHRSFVELPVPGRTGSLFHDLSPAPTQIAIRGSLYGDEARNQFLEEVRTRFRAGQPVTFVADIVTATEVQYVVIETLHFQATGRRPDEIEYSIVLQESPPPPPPSDPLGGLEAGLLDQAGGLLDTVTGALDAIEALTSVPAFGDPTAPLSGLLAELGEVTGDLPATLAPLTDLFAEP